MSIYGDPVLLGGGGKVKVLLNEQKYRSTSGGTFDYSKTVTAEADGVYFISAFGYAYTVTVKINGVTQPLSYNASQDYTLWYAETLNLHSGDIVEIDIVSSGRSAASAQVIRLS